ncbi:PREDICTED: proteasome assembly chaperone 4 isoform X1 [Nelumbo nucifera]|uniref:Proteasome assembly chaperone 4 isoform X1 n=1 Tax=Nelumbo nucifera TaxID=4432 RepID=A0A1U8B3Y0_NELNU|nr:PREDICTED: proteasome assembly chaperone 4 isoform X1 [Nelumbo nucifera]XP_010275565.1 PREDICTED: proteasome assembly chaperone 4 isoform X1 [Nelumbo nucifera]XP_010275575.1 PREDICTED: proteasome assembly chaperone 4 isoform X1 [Nelumbo nucifera]
MASGELKGHFDVAVAKDLSGKESTSAVSTGDGDGIQITCFTEDLNDVTFHFQIIRLEKQIYAWIGCNSAKLGHLYAAAPTRPNNAVSVASILGGASDNTGSSIARRIVLKTGLNVILACNIPKNSPMLEADAERKLMEKLKELGYTRSRSQGSVLSNS